MPEYCFLRRYSSKVSAFFAKFLLYFSRCTRSELLCRCHSFRLKSQDFSGLCSRRYIRAFPTICRCQRQTIPHRLRRKIQAYRIWKSLCSTAFATLFFKNVFSGRWNSHLWFATKPKNRIIFKAFALLWAEAFFMRLFWLPDGTAFRFLGWCSLCIYPNSRFVSFTFVETRAIFSLKGVTAMDQEKIGNFLAENRKAKGFTQIEFAEKLGVSNKSVSRWETGKNNTAV